MFGFRNFTGFSFVAKAGRITLEFTAGMVEEVTLNITGSAAAHAAEIPQAITGKLISKDQLIASSSAIACSKLVKTNLVNVIAGATTNLFI